MGLITETVEIKVNYRSIKHYEKLGYNIPKKEASESSKRHTHRDWVYDTNTPIEVNVCDLPKGTHIKVRVQCDCCENIRDMPYYEYVKYMQRDRTYRCFECAQIYRMDNLVKQYGVDNIFKLQEYQDKANKTKFLKYGTSNIAALPEVIKRKEETMQLRYGVSNPMESEEFKNKQIQTVQNKYGYDSVFKVPEIKEKRNQTIRMKYKVDNISQLEKIKQKKKDTCRKHYNVDNPMQDKNIREKTYKTNRERYNTLYGFNINRIPCSSQQKYICDLYNMELNKPLLNYHVDMYDSSIRLICEYDGSGHLLCVTIGNNTQEEYDRKQMIRSIQLKNDGHKTYRIISRKDYLPSDDTLLQMLSDAKQYFSDYPEHSWITFDIDNEIVRNAENKDGVPYFYGELRKIKKTDVSLSA